MMILGILKFEVFTDIEVDLRQTGGHQIWVSEVRVGEIQAVNGAGCRVRTMFGTEGSSVFTIWQRDTRIQ